MNQEDVEMKVLWKILASLFNEQSTLFPLFEYDSYLSNHNTQFLHSKGINKITFFNNVNTFKVYILPQWSSWLSGDGCQ